MSGYSPEALAVRMVNGDDLIITAINGAYVGLKADIVTSRGEWIHATVKGYGPRGLWINTAHIATVEEVAE